MTFLGQTEQHFFPIIDHYNKPIQNPNPYQINTSQMRGFAKLFAMVSGFGLSLYVGEDLAYLDDEKNNPKQQARLKKTLTKEEKKARFIKYINEHYTDFKTKVDECKSENSAKSLDEVSYEKLEELATFIKDNIEQKKGA